MSRIEYLALAVIISAVLVFLAVLIGDSLARSVSVGLLVVSGLLFITRLVPILLQREEKTQSARMAVQSMMMDHRLERLKIERDLRLA